MMPSIEETELFKELKEYRLRKKFDEKNIFENLNTIKELEEFKKKLLTIKPKNDGLNRHQSFFIVNNFVTKTMPSSFMACSMPF